jgi:hypothetical protein
VRQIATIASPIASLQTLDSLQELLSQIRPPIVCMEDVKLLVQYMKSKKMLVILDTEASVVRVKLPSDKGPLVITEEHKNIAKLQLAAKNISKAISELDKRLNGLRATVSLHLKQKDRPSAINVLKRTKELETAKMHRLNCLDTIETMLMKIEGAKSDAEIFNLYRLGETTLKQALSELPSATAVDDVMVSIQDLMADQETISQAISQRIEEEDDELLAELALYQLPEVPSPITSSEVRSPMLSDGLEIIEKHMQALEIGSPPPKEPILM